ncbi:uncharacterized protein LOC135703478 [Ochlerotatus camptorhynchus]|uniref:uncharacterized protein LOC135703478 n=1 Tax=Ochlerotatus camptorhynchus TaxID=644619 RepID=UPI0031D7AFBD
MASNEGSSKTWTADETYRLIRAFRKHPALWKKENSEYKNKPFRAGILEQLAIEFRTNAEAIKEKLRSLRTIYGQNLKKHAKTDGTPKWEFFGALSFLKGEMSGDSADMITDLSMKADENSTDSTADRIEDVPIQCQSHEPAISIKRMRTQSPVSKHQNKDNHVKATNLPLLDLQSGRNRPFGDYVALSLDLMKNALIEEKVKLQIQLLLSEALTETATSALSQLPSPSQTPAYAQSALVRAFRPSVEQKWRPDDPLEFQPYEDGQELPRMSLMPRTSSLDSFQ